MKFNTYFKTIIESFDEEEGKVDLGDGYSYEYFTDDEGDKSVSYTILTTPDGVEHTISPHIKASLQEIVQFHKETGKLPEEKDFVKPTEDRSKPDMSKWNF